VELIYFDDHRSSVCNGATLSTAFNMKTSERWA